MPLVTMDHVSLPAVWMLRRATTMLMRLQTMGLAWSLAAWIQKD